MTSHLQGFRALPSTLRSELMHRMGKLVWQTYPWSAGRCAWAMQWSPADPRVPVRAGMKTACMTAPAYAATSLRRKGVQARLVVQVYVGCKGEVIGYGIRAPSRTVGGSNFGVGPAASPALNQVAGRR